MPLFEYVCRDCGRLFERILPRYDSPVDCPGCNSVAVEKQLSVFAVAGASSSGDIAEAGDAGCGRCGAAQPGMCGFES